MAKEINTRNALERYLEECESSNISAELSVDTIFFIFRVVIQETASRTEGIGYVNNLHTWISVRKEDRIIGVTDAIKRRVKEYFSYRCVNPIEYKFPDFSIFTCGKDEYLKMRNKETLENKRKYELFRLCSSVMLNIEEFSKKIDRSVITQCNYYLSMSHTKRHRGIYAQFYKILSLYIFEEYNKFK